MFYTSTIVVPYNFVWSLNGGTLYYYNYKDGVTDIFKSKVRVYSRGQGENFLKNMNLQEPVKIYMNDNVVYKVEEV